MKTGLFAVWQLMVVAGWRNRVGRQLQRLKKPRYLVASLIGIGYFVWVFGLQRRSMSIDGERPPQFLEMMELMFTAFGFLAVVAAWIFGNDRAALNFPEAEVQFLFPAPYSRRQLIRFKLLRALVRTLFSAGVTTLFFGRGMEHRGFFFVGVFLALSTLSLHVVGASFLREALTRFGWSGVVRRVLPIALMVAVVGGTLLFTWQTPPPPDLSSVTALTGWLRLLYEAPPLSWLLYPVRAPIRVALAPDAGAFFSALPVAVVVLLVHYFWVERSDVSFEEASLANAERRAKLSDARVSSDRGAPTGKVKSRSLSAAGAPELAIIWKNLIAARRVYSLRVLPSLLMIAGGLAAASVLFFPRAGGNTRFVIGLFCAAGALLLVLIGPSAARIDLRQDLPAIDVLRAWPLSGFQVMRAEIFGAAAVLGALQWLLLLAAAGFTYRMHVPGVGVSARIAMVIAVMLVAPALSLAGLVVQNAAALMFPSWVSPEAHQQRGVEVLGQRLLTLLGTWVVLLLVVTPVAGVGLGVTALLIPWLGFWAAPVGAAVVAGGLGSIALAATYGLGRQFERFDPTD